jgi:hypothetical protein
MELTDKEREQIDLFAKLVIDEIGEERYSEIMEEAFGPQGDVSTDTTKCGYGPYCCMMCHMNQVCAVRPVCQV